MFLGFFKPRPEWFDLRALIKERVDSFKAAFKAFTTGAVPWIKETFTAKDPILHLTSGHMNSVSFSNDNRLILHANKLSKKLQFLLFSNRMITPSRFVSCDVIPLALWQLSVCFIIVVLPERHEGVCYESVAIRGRRTARQLGTNAGLFSTVC